MHAISIRSAALAAACLCGIAAPLAQQPLPQQPPAASSTAPPTGVLAGQVIDAATKKPIAGAMVGLAGSGMGAAGRTGPPREMAADSQGRFAFVALVPGRYTVISQHPGYASVFGAPSRAVDLMNGGRVTDVVVRLHPFTSITGTVTDENGDPVTGAGVSAIRQAVVVNGRAVPSVSGEARTDDRGEYRLTNLLPGDYVVCACRQDPIPLDGVLLNTLAAEPAQLLGVAARALKVGADVASIEGMRTFAPAFFPASPTMTRATHVVVAEGENRTNVDIQVPIVRPARVSGTIVGSPGGINANAIRLRPTGEVPSVAATIEPMLVQPDGRFDFAGVPPGTYVLSAWLSGLPAPMGGPSGTALQLAGGRVSQQMQQVAMDSIVWGQTTVVVGDSDITGVTVNLRRAPTMKTRIELPPNMAPPSQPPRPGQQIQFVRLTPMSLDIRGGGQFVRPDPTGAFVLPSAGPGKYFIEVGSSLQISKVTVAGEDVTDLPIEIGEADITDAVVSLVYPERTMISGTVTGAGADTTVLIFPADPKLWTEPAASRRWFSTVVVDGAGKFSTAPNLVAGNYLVAAVPDEQAVNWIIQTRLQTLASRAQKVTVAAGETKLIEVKR